MSLREDLLELKEMMCAYHHANTDCIEAKVNFAIAISALIDSVNDRMHGYLEALDNGECDEPLGIDYRTFSKVESWPGFRRLRQDLSTPEPVMLKSLRMKKRFFEHSEVTTREIFEDIDHGLHDLARLMKEIRDRISHADIRLFGHFYLKQKNHRDGWAVTEAYEEAKMSAGELNYDWLIRMQTQVVADFMKKGILRFSPDPTLGEIMKVRKDQTLTNRIRESMPCSYEIPDDYEAQSALLRRYTFWQGDVFNINYNYWGKYLFRAYYDLSPDERQALFDLDIMLSLIHNDMTGLKPSEQPVDDGWNVNEPVEKLKPLFYNNETVVRQFLKEIEGMPPNDITDLVNRWVEDRRISNYGNSRKGELWEILTDAGLYTKSRQNWNRRVY